jgi:hypothetical protein
VLFSSAVGVDGPALEMGKLAAGEGGVRRADDGDGVGGERLRLPWQSVAHRSTRSTGSTSGSRGSLFDAGIMSVGHRSGRVMRQVRENAPPVAATQVGAARPCGLQGQPRTCASGS